MIILFLCTLLEFYLTVPNKLAALFGGLTSVLFGSWRYRYQQGRFGISPL